MILNLQAFQDQKKRFEKLKSRFSQIVSRHLNNLFIHLVSCTSVFFHNIYLFDIFTSFCHLFSWVIQVFVAYLWGFLMTVFIISSSVFEGKWPRGNIKSSCRAVNFAPSWQHSQWTTALHCTNALDQSSWPSCLPAPEQDLCYFN